MKKKTGMIMILVAATATTAFLVGCGQAPPPPAATGIAPKDMTDALFAVMEADRATYTKNVVKRMHAHHEKDVMKASEFWPDEPNNIPLPAQMFRMASERVAKKGVKVSYQLKSSWPINPQNLPKSDTEKEGFKYIEDNGGKEPFYKEEEIAGKKYFTAIYADVAVSEACTNCHNKHQDTPRDDFKLNDTMGGVVIRIPLD